MKRDRGSSTKKVKNRCWENASIVLGRHPVSGIKTPPATSSAGCLGCLCFEYDHIVPFSKDKEFNLIEMAVNGDVIRPGKKCRCRTVAEVLGQCKSKDLMAPCKLPQNEDAS